MIVLYKWIINYIYHLKYSAKTLKIVCNSIKLPITMHVVFVLKLNKPTLGF